MTSSNRESSSQSQHMELVHQIRASLRFISDRQIRSRSILLRLPEELHRLIFDFIFLKHGIREATCFGLASKQLYQIFKSYHPNPVHLSAREFDRTNLYPMYPVHHRPFLAQVLKDFMAPRYRPRNRAEYRYLPVDKYGKEPGSQEEKELDDWYEEHPSGTWRPLGSKRPYKVVFPWMTSTKIYWSVEEARIVKEILSRQ